MAKDKIKLSFIDKMVISLGFAFMDEVAEANPEKAEEIKKVKKTVKKGIKKFFK